MGNHERSFTRLERHTNLSIELNGVWDVTNHLGMAKHLLHLAILGDLEYPNLARTSRRQRNLLHDIVHELADGASLGQQEGVCSFFLVVNTSPDDLQTPLGLKLDDANVQFLVQDNGGGRVDITWRHDFSDALVQRSLENGLGCAIADVRRREPKLDRVMAQSLADLIRHLLNAQLAGSPVSIMIHETHDVVVLLLAQDEVEFRVLWIRLLMFGSEEDHDAVLEEVVELHRIRVKALHLQIMDPATEEISTSPRSNHRRVTHSFSGRSTWKQMISPSWISL